MTDSWPPSHTMGVQEDQLKAKGRQQRKANINTNAFMQIQIQIQKQIQKQIQLQIQIQIQIQWESRKTSKKRNLQYAIFDFSGTQS